MRNKVEKVKVSKMKLGEPDSSGRKKPIEEKNSDLEIKADLVIKALGFDPENLPELFGESDLQVSKWGTIKADFDNMETSIPGVFISIKRKLMPACFFPSVLVLTKQNIQSDI